MPRGLTGKGRAGASARVERPIRKRRSILLRVTILLLVPLLSLIALWAGAVGLTLTSALQKEAAGTTYDDIGGPAGFIAGHIGAERSLSTRYLAGDATIREQMLAQRARTDAMRTSFEKSARSSKARAAADPVVRRRLDELMSHLDGLGSLRSSIDTRTTGTLAVIEAYGQIVDDTCRLYSAIAVVNDLQIYRESLAIINVNRGQEFMLRESALIAAAAVAGGTLSTTERVAITQWAAAGRHSMELGAQDFADENRPALTRLTESPGYRDLRALEDAIATGRSGRLPAAQAAAWQTSSAQTAEDWIQLVNQAGLSLVQRAKPIGDQIILRLVLAGGLGLVAVLLSVGLSLRFARGLARELRELRGAAGSLADARLPSVVDRLRRGENVDVMSEAPPLPAGRTTEVAEVADAFGRVQRTAIETAVGEAHLRQGISRVFLNIAWRSQSLLHRQLRMLDSMERKNTDPEVVADLFRLDHLTTRMRRHAEGLVILSGAVPGRGWNRPVPVEDVLRAAASEVEDYTRVEIFTASEAMLAGTAVADVVHLLAELIENATIFSPPRTQVTVRAELVGNGLALEIIDRGIGIDSHDRAELNLRLSRPPEYDLVDSERLGLFVVARLAARQGIRVALQESPYGGTTAVVLLPHELVVEGWVEQEPGGDPSIEQSERLGRFGRPDASGVIEDHTTGIEQRPAGIKDHSAAFEPHSAGAGPFERREPGRRNPVPPGSPDEPAPWPARRETTAADSPQATGRPAPPYYERLAFLPAEHVARARTGPEGDETTEPVEHLWGGVAGSASPEWWQNGRASRPDGDRLRPAPWRDDDGPRSGPQHIVHDPLEDRPRLPRRERQANLAPQLRAEPAAGTAGPQRREGERPDPEPSAEASRDLMDALQTGWLRGREHDDEDTDLPRPGGGNPW